MSFLRMYGIGGTVLGGAVLVGGLAAGAQTADKATMPDAQVESNVLRQLAGAPELSTQNIQTTTVYGVVTLSGNVHDEALRSKAENLAARAEGVKKVVDELTLGDTPAVANDQQPGDPNAANGNMADPNAGAPGPGMVLQSDGTYAPAQGDPQQAPVEQANNNPPPNGYQQQPNGDQPPQGYNNGAPNDGPGGPQGPPPPHQPMYRGYADDGGPYAGQRAGMQVTVPAGAPIQIRINRGLDSNNVTAGTPFTGVVLYDVVAGGAVAIPRGAMVSGTVVEAKKAGTLKGRGELVLQLTGLTLGGQNYALVSDVWGHNGHDKTTSTVNRAIGLGAIGALFGAAAGGGAGAAIGAGIGGAAGVASSAASPDGRVFVAPESVLSFSLAQPAQVTTVSQQEMARLSYAAGPPPPPRPGYRRRYYSPYYGYYYGPGY